MGDAMGDPDAIIVVEVRYLRGLEDRIAELEALLERARERIYSGPVSVAPNDALWNDIGRALAAAEKP